MRPQIVQIHSRDAAFQKLQVLQSNRTKRGRYGEFFVEGVRNLNEAQENAWEFSALMYCPGLPLSDWAKEKLERVPAEQHIQLTDPALLEELSGKSDASELMAVVKMRPNELSRLEEKAGEKPVFVLFDRPSNRGNLGTILRSCDGFGAAGLILTGHGVDLYDPEVVGAGMGSFFRVPAVHVPEKERIFSWIAAMREKYPGFRTVGTTAHRQQVLWEQDLSGPLLFFIGNETDGLSYGFKEACDLLCTIPMADTSGASSFNVACAASVLLYEAARQRKGRIA